MREEREEIEQLQSQVREDADRTYNLISEAGKNLSEKAKAEYATTGESMGMDDFVLSYRIGDDKDEAMGLLARVDKASEYAEKAGTSVEDFLEAVRTRLAQLETKYTTHPDGRSQESAEGRELADDETWMVEKAEEFAAAYKAIGDNWGHASWQAILENMRADGISDWLKERMESVRDTDPKEFVARSQEKKPRTHDDDGASYGGGGYMDPMGGNNAANTYGTFH